MLALHQLVEELEAPALAWNRLAYYWGMSALGIGPQYVEYLQSERAAVDAAFNALANEGLQIYGLNRSLTIKERFDRAANFYAYCYEQGVRTSINPPFDMPPDVDQLIASRLRLEPKSQRPDKVVQAANEHVLGDRPELMALWAAGGQEKREQRAQLYNARVLETLNYIASELKSRVQLTADQLSDTGFLRSGYVRDDMNVTAELMDEVMPQEVQWEKLGDSYVQRTLKGAEITTELVCTGLLGAYYTMGHNLEQAMYDEENKARLSSIYHAILRSWRQLYEVSKNESV